MKIHVIFPKYSFYSGKSTDEQRLLLRAVDEIVERFLNIDGVVTQYAVEDESAVKLLDKVKSKEEVTFISDKQFLTRYNDRYYIFPDAVWNKVRYMEPIRESASKWKAPIKRPEQTTDDWLAERIQFCKNMCKCNMEQYLKGRGNNILYIEDNSKTNIVSYHKIASSQNDGRLVIKINIHRIYAAEAYMGGVPIDIDMAARILQTM